MRIIIFIVLVSMFGSASAQWELDESVDAMTDEVSRKAYVASEDGHAFVVVRKNDGKVWGYLMLPEGEFFKINDAVMLRVDKNKPKNFDDRLQREFGVASYEWKPDLLGFLIWHGKAGEGCGLVGELLKGDEMVIRYHPRESTLKDVRFDISENRKAVRAGLWLEEGQCE